MMLPSACMQVLYSDGSVLVCHVVSGSAHGLALTVGAGGGELLELGFLERGWRAGENWVFENQFKVSE